MARRSIPTRPFTIRRRDTTPLAWRSPLASASLWERLGEEAGAGAPAGAATIPSTSTTTIISTATRISTAGTATTLVAEAAAMETGRTIRNIPAAPPIGNEQRRTGSAGRHVETLCPIVNPTPGNKLGNKVAIWPVIVLVIALVIVLVIVASTTERVGEEGTA